MKRRRTLDAICDDYLVGARGIAELSFVPA
jgi:hypothetical protein